MSLVLRSSKILRTGAVGVVPGAPSSVPGGAGLPRPGMQIGLPTPSALSTVTRGVTPMASLSLGSVLGGIGSVLSGIGSGGIGGGVSALGGLISGSKPGTGPTVPGIGGTGTGITSTGNAGGSCVTVLGQTICLGGSVGSGSQFTAGGGSGITVTGGQAAGAGGVVTPSGGVVPRGYHLNKRGYYTKAGYVAPHSKAVKNRRRNPLNPRALHHALSRMVGFHRASKSIEKSLERVARRQAPRRSPRGITRAPEVKLLTAGSSCGCGG